MSMSRRLVFLGLTILFLTGVCGCAMSDHQSDAEMTKLDQPATEQPEQEQEWEVVGAMRRYLQDKYGVFDYDIVSYQGRNWSQDFDTLYGEVREKDRSDIFQVERHGDGDSYSFQDSYFGLLVRPELEQFISRQAKKFYSDFRVIAAPEEHCYPEKLTVASDLEDMIACARELEPITFLVFTSDSFAGQKAFEDKAADFAADWAETGLPAVVRVVNVAADELESIDRDSYGEFLKQSLANDSLVQFSQVVDG